MGLKEDLESLRDTLKDELAKDRIDPVVKISSTSNEDNHMRSQLQEEKIRNDSLTSKLEALNSEVSDACDFIDRLKTDLKRESSKVNDLQNKLSESQKEFVFIFLLFMFLS
jgi:chromosome segregation ATPase